MRRWGLTFLAIAMAIGFAAWVLFPDMLIARNTDIDEGVFLMVARLLHRGCDVHAFFFDQFWFFPKLLATSFKFFGDSLLVGRLTTFAFALTGVLGVGVLIYVLGGKRSTAILALIVCAASPLYIRQSRMVMADVPATACLVWALVFVFLFQERRQRVWLALSGTFASAALMLKPFAIGFIVAIIVILFAARSERVNGRFKLDPATWSDMLIFVVAGVVIATPFIDLFHPIEEYRRTIGFHFAERNWLIKRVDDRWRGLVGFFRLHIPLLLFAISGIVALRPLSPRILALLASEIATTGILLTMPPWLHHYVLLLPALIVFATLGFPRGLIQFKQSSAALRCGQNTTLRQKYCALIFAVALAISLIDLPWLVRFERRALWPPAIHVEPVVQYLSKNPGRQDYLISDDALVLYLANRAMPPWAINFTYGNVLRFDPSSFERFQQLIRDNNITDVVATTSYLRNRRLLFWLNGNFPLVTVIGGDKADDLSATVYSKGKGAPSH